MVVRAVWNIHRAIYTPSYLLPLNTTTTGYKKYTHSQSQHAAEKKISQKDAWVPISLMTVYMLTSCLNGSRRLFKRGRLSLMVSTLITHVDHPLPTHCTVAQT